MKVKKEKSLTFDEWKKFKDLGLGDMSFDDMVLVNQLRKKISKNISNSETMNGVMHKVFHYSNNQSAYDVNVVREILEMNAECNIEKYCVSENIISELKNLSVNGIVSGLMTYNIATLYQFCNPSLNLAYSIDVNVISNALISAGISLAGISLLVGIVAIALVIYDCIVIYLNERKLN